MSNTNLKRLALAREVEEALKNYIGTDTFPTEEWPAVALAFADVVVATGDVSGLEGAQELVRRMSKLDGAIADLVGL